MNCFPYYASKINTVTLFFNGFVYLSISYISGLTLSLIHLSGCCNVSLSKSFREDMWLVNFLGSSRS